MRTAVITRTTRETDITLTLTLDGSGKTSLSTGIGFFDHMLDALCRFGQLDLALTCRGDLHVDAHHTVEDVGICLGRAIRDALGDRAANPVEGSYTNYLLDNGVEKICKKVGEEASETIIAAMKANKEEVTYEAADLLYHLMVLLYQQGVTLDDVWAEMARRR